MDGSNASFARAWAIRFRIACVVTYFGAGACVNLAPPAVNDLGDGGRPDTPSADRPFEAKPEVSADVPIDAVGADTFDAGDAGGVDATPAFANGHGCLAGNECVSGLCVDKVCCASACDGTCAACNVAGQEGTCTPVPAGEDPADECAMDATTTCGRDGTCDGAGACRKYQVGTQCAPGSCTGSMETPASTCDATGACKAESAHACPSGGVCQGGTCATACSADAGCSIGAFCDSNVCRLKLTSGTTCSRDGMCASNYCADGVCCGTPCKETCNACNLPGSVGTCKAVPAGQDPRNVCAADTAGNPCGYDGFCNGAGACRQPSGTACGAASCSNGKESLVGSCNGVGTCTPGPARDCGAYACAGTACGTSCSSDGACTPGYVCSGDVCVALPGPVLYWKLDEASGTTAFDATSFGNHGTYTSAVAGNLPASSSVLPPLTFANAASREILRAPRHAVLLSNPPASLKPLGDATVSLWYRASAGDPDTGDSEVFSLGDNIVLRLRATSLEASKRTATGHVQCLATTSKLFDGGWHNFVAVYTQAETRIYFDGALMPATSPQNGAGCSHNAPVYYPSATFDLWIGRHGSGTSPVRDYEGLLDDIRFYTRALSAAEVALLAAGKP